MATIGFIGLGNMGMPMAANLVKAGHVVKGFDVVATHVDAAKEFGVDGARSANQAAENVDAVVTMLPAGRHVIEVYTGGVFDTAGAGTLFIDSSTIDVASARQAHDLAREAGMLSLDAPVSGGVGGAQAGTLTFMAGGSDAAFTKARPVLDAMGHKIVHCGEGGAGQSAKVCNNMLLAISMIGASEAFTLGEKLGLSHQALFDVMSTSSGSCWAVNTYCPVPGPVPTSPANNDYKPGFSTALMTKDLTLAQEAASSVGAATPLGAEATQLMRMFMSGGNGGRDFSAIIEFIRGGEDKG